MPFSDFGRIGRDVELRYTPNGDAVANIPVAVDYGRKGQDGRKPTQWVELTMWGKQAEALAQYMTKGKQIYFSAGDIHIETFTKSDGVQASKLCGRLESVKFASDGSQAAHPQASAARQPAPRQQTQAPPVQQQAPAPNYDDFDDDIPF